MSFSIYRLYGLIHHSIHLLYHQFHLSITKTNLKFTFWSGYGDASSDSVWCEYEDTSPKQSIVKKGVSERDV